MFKRLKLTGIVGFLVVAVGVAGCANMQQAATTTTKPTGDVADTLKSLGTFDTFLAAADAAGVTDVLKREKPITVFAPTDEAFGKLPPGRLRHLMAPANRARLRAMVLSHILDSAVMTDHFINGVREVRTEAGTRVEVNGLDPGKGIYFGRARISKPNIEASNGVIQVLDRVVLP